MPNYNKMISDTSIRLGLVRFGYVHVFQPHAVEETDSPKYSVQIMIPKTDDVAVKMIESAVQAAKEVGKTSKWGGKIPPDAKLKLPLRDGDAEYPDDKDYKGMWFMNASSSEKRKPEVKILSEGMLQDALDDGKDFYSGCWGCVSVNLFPFEGKSNGVAVGLNNVIKMKDDEHLGGGGRSAEEDFDDLVGGGASWAD